MKDTICAPATAPGGAIAIIRLSGPDAISIACSVCSNITPTTPANTIHYTHISNPHPCDAVSPHQIPIDEALVSIFHGPHSYTGEDIVELSCHGSPYILNKVLELLVNNGCRMANPGEFTMRAYLNGKLDLSQAEAVADLITSTNRATHRLAMSQLRGGISSELEHLREQLLRLTSLLELELDFSDHEDLEFADRTELLKLTNKIDKQITNLALTFETGQAIRQGFPVAIVGKTNVGKSTLLNALLKDDRAIVSEIHGTTRDTIEDTIDLHGITFRFIDTAGIRQTTDQVEQIGIQRTFQAIHKARIVLWLIDAQPTEEDIRDIVDRIDDKRLIIIQNKIDKYSGPDLLPACLNKYPFVKISAKSCQGITKLEQAILEAANIPTITDSNIIITNARHYESLIHAQQNLSRVISGLNASNVSGDILAEDLRQVPSDLAEITGRGQITTNEVLENIFSHFCVGK